MAGLLGSAVPVVTVGFSHGGSYLDFHTANRTCPARIYRDMRSALCRITSSSDKHVDQSRRVPVI